MTPYLVLCNYATANYVGTVNGNQTTLFWVKSDNKQHAARDAARFIYMFKPHWLNLHIQTVLSPEDWGDAHFTTVDMKELNHLDGSEDTVRDSVRNGLR
jgi:hypothetical protein